MQNFTKFGHTKIGVTCLNDSDWGISYPVISTSQNEINTIVKCVTPINYQPADYADACRKVARHTREVIAELNAVAEKFETSADLYDFTGEIHNV